jgi:uncharacterized damage-inducible protein DinB
MHRREEIRDLYVFNEWANTRMRETLAPLSETEFRRDLKNSYPSIRDTVLHIMGSEWVWLTRWQGTSPASQPLHWADYTRAQIESEWATIHAAQLSFIDGLSETDLDAAIAYINFRGESFAQPLWQLMRHMVNHSTYHRGQITTMLRQLGHAAVATDLVLYYRQQPQVVSP